MSPTPDAVHPTPTGRKQALWLWSRSAGHRAASAALVLLVVLGLAGASRVAWVATVGVGPQVHPEQLRYLQEALDHGAAEETQDLFPEGFFFMQVLTGLAAAQPARPGDQQALAAVRRALAAVQSPSGVGRFAGQNRPVNGVFWAGWSLLLEVEQARLSGLAADRQQVRVQATAIKDALASDDDGFLDSYPGQVWPVDNMVAVAALARADALVRVPGAAATVTAWPGRIARFRDAATGLLPHQLGSDRMAAEGPRGSSQALLLAFEPEVDPELAAQDYRRFVATFVVRRLGLVGVREHPVGTTGDADTNSGPLLWGVSASASAVALAAAARQQDRRLADDLNAEAELLGLPVTWDGKRRYGGGELPIGDAFLAWARSQPPSPAPAGRGESPRPLWLVWGIAGLLPGALAAIRRKPLFNWCFDPFGDPAGLFVELPGWLTTARQITGQHRSAPVSTGQHFLIDWTESSAGRERRSVTAATSSRIGRRGHPGGQSGVIRHTGSPVGPGWADLGRAGWGRAGLCAVLPQGWRQSGVSRRTSSPVGPG